MTDDQRVATITQAEAWFELNGLPYFVSSNEERVHAALARGRVLPLLMLAVLISAALGTVVGLAAEDAWAGVFVGAVGFGVIAFGYAFASLHFRPIMKWALSQTFGSLGWIFPLITRALPLLLLFITFLFINTEVWQVTSELSRGFLWSTVLMFASIAVAFLLVRLPEEVRDVSDQARGDQLVSICAETPVAQWAGEVVDEAADAPLSRLQKVNLVLVLLFAQALQVLLLSLSVFVFFVAFGKLAIKDAVIQAWLGEGTKSNPIPHHLPSLEWLPISNELFQVSVFLAAFSGLYFTVYAVTDETYRRQFFTDIARELERAIGVQRVYRALTADRRR